MARAEAASVDASISAAESNFERMAAGLTTITRWLCVGAAVIAVLLPLPVFYEVMMDQLQQPPIWVFELTGYAIIMIAFAASGYALKTGHHFRVTLLPDRYPAFDVPLQRLAGLLELGFGLMLLVAGAGQAFGAWQEDTTSDTLLAVPLVWPQLAFPIGGLAIALQGLAHVLDPRRHRMHDVPHP